MTRCVHRRGGGDAGATLILVLALTVVMALAIGALLPAVRTGLVSARPVEEARRAALASEGAVDAAIAFLRPDRTRGRSGVSCPSFATGSLAGAVTVECTPIAGSGQPQPGAAAPAHALFTTRGLPGYPTGTGITASGNNPVRIGGAVVSNSAIQVASNSRLDAAPAPVTATGTCGPGPVDGTPVTCNTGATVADPSGTDAGTDPSGTGGWASPLTGPTAPAPATALCNPTSKVAVMPPGSYLSLPKLVAELGACTVVWMPPGAYYLDFGVASPGQVSWGFDETLVGGTPLGWDPAATTAPTVPVPGACDPAQPGVHVVLGADTRLDVGGKARIEWCGPPSGSPRVVLYGRKSTTTPASTTFPTVRPTAATASPTGLATPPADLLAIDAITNTGSISGSNASGSATLTGYDLSAIPYGSQITQLRVRVAHRRTSGSLAANNPRVTVSAPGQATNPCTNLAVPVTTTLTTQTVTCATNLTWTGTAPATVIYQFQRPSGSGTTGMELDGVELEVTYVPPGLRAQTMGTTALAMTAGGGNKAQVWLRGTVSLPRAAVNLDLKNNNEFAVTHGAVVLSITIANVPPAQDVPTFGLPGGGSFTDRRVDLVARIAGTRTLRARVVLVDDPGPGHAVLVEAWNAVN
jgi:hypothetical protein